MDTTPDKRRSLDDVRRQIDRIDETLHRLVVERTGLASEVWRAKDRSMAGLAAVRPAREARMLRAFAGRHQGQIPLPVVWRIWRELIVANIRVQAPFSVHLPDNAGGCDVLRDLARAHFGFETEFTGHRTAAAALDVAARSGAIAVLPAAGMAEWGEWGLARDGRVRIFSVLPQIVSEVAAPVAFLAGDVAIEASGADTATALFVGTASQARAAAREQGRQVAYLREAAGRCLVGLGGLEPCGGGFSDLGAHADALISAD